MEELLNRYSQIPDRMRYAGALATFVVLAALHYVLIYSGQRANLNDLEEQFRKHESEQAEKNAYAANLPKYQARFDELTLSLTTARAMLPDNPDVPQFLAQLGNAARDVGLTVDRFEPKSEVAQDFYAEIGFGMKVHGAFHDIAMFIDQMARIDRIVNVTALSMTMPKVENQKIILASDFLVKTYRFLTEEQAAAIEAKKKVKK
jgi:type IV pilus assembly protein PilO